MLRMYVFLLLTTCISGQLNAQQSLPADVEATINQRIADGIYPGLCLGVIDADGTTYFSYGVTREGGKAIDEQSIFEIGSITKAFTGILLADMHLKGLIHVDDPVQKYLPTEVQVPSRNGAQITLGHLSDHTSSLPRMPSNFSPADPLNPYADYSVQQMYDFISDCDLTRDIGSRYEYSNLAQGLLGHVLALKAGMPYEDLVKQNITAPLGMDHTGITLTPVMQERLAVPHSWGMEVSVWDIPTLSGAGALRSSVHDMLKFLTANLSRQDALGDAMQLSHNVRHHHSGVRVGLGWHIEPGNAGDIFWHNGGTGGYRAFAGFVKETGRGVVVLVNSDIGADDIGFYMLGAGVLQKVKPNVVNVLRRHIDAQGADAIDKKFSELKTSEKDKYDFGEMQINALGYHYLGLKNLDAALALFKINTEEYPESANVWDSYGEAFLAKGDTTAAVENYTMSIRLNPGNTHAITLLESMGIDTGIKEVTVSTEIMQSYVGVYELMPGFSIEITVDGDKLSGQGTGQPKFDMFAKTDEEFYLKVVDARIKFNKNDDGEVVSMTLFQGGQVLEGTRQ